MIKLYVLAFIIFIYLFKFRSDKKGIFSGFWANISYPLYAVHSTVGFSLLSFFTYKIRINIFVSLFLVIIIVIFLSWILHKYVELPSLKKSQKIK